MKISVKFVATAGFSQIEKKIKGAKCIQTGQIKKFAYWDAWKSLYQKASKFYFCNPSMDTINGARTLMAKIYEISNLPENFKVDEWIVQQNQLPDSSVESWLVTYDELDEYGNWKG